MWSWAWNSGGLRYFSCKAVLVVFSGDSHMKKAPSLGGRGDNIEMQGAGRVCSLWYRSARGTRADFLSHLCARLWRASVEIVWRAGCVGRQCWSGRCDCNKTELSHGQTMESRTEQVCTILWVPGSGGQAGLVQVWCYDPCRSCLHDVLLGIQSEKKKVTEKSHLKNKIVF